MTQTEENHVELHLVVPRHISEDESPVQFAFSGCTSCASIALASLMNENSQMFDVITQAVALVVMRKKQLTKETQKKTGRKTSKFSPKLTSKTMAKIAVMVEITLKGGSANESDFRVFGFGDNEAVADGIAEYALQNNQWAEVLILANEKINNAGWRAGKMAETF